MSGSVLSARPYRIFICHAYDHRDIYFELVRKLNNANYFDWRNLSVQYDMRFGSGETDVDNDELRVEIGRKIAESELLLVLTKPVASRRRWLQWEIAHAKGLGKPIIGIARKRNDKVSSFVKQHANDIVDTWRINHIISAIKLYGNTYRYEQLATPLVVVPSSLPPESPDVEVSPEPTPLAPDEQANMDETIEVLDEPTPGLLPRDVLFHTLGSYVPGDGTAGLHSARRPRWWWPFSKEL